MTISLRATARFAALAIIAGGFVAGVGVGEAQAEKIRWKMPMAFGSNLPGLGSPAPWFADRINAVSGGEIQVRVYEPGKLVPPFEILSAVSEGKVAAGYTWPGYDQGTVPATALFAAVPFGLKPWAFTAWYFYHGGHDMVQEAYKNKGYNVHAQLCGIIGPETAGWYRKPIESLDDYKGMKIRFAGLGGKVLEKLGASVTMMPGGELFQALEKGTIDATEFSIPITDQVLGFDKVVSYNLFPGWHQTFTAQYVLVNGDEWGKLNDQQKSQIETTCTAATLIGLSEGEHKNGYVMKNYMENGVTAGQLSKEVLQELKKITAEVLQEEAEKDADFKRIYESQQEFQEVYEIWDERAYIPAGSLD